MSEITLTILELVLTIVTMWVARYFIPYLKNSFVMSIVKKGVYMAQQIHWAETGAARKEIVIQYVNDILSKLHINITKEELSVLIEAVVKQLRIEEGRANGSNS